MPAYHTGFTRKVREAARKLEKFSINELANEVGVQTYVDKRKVKNVVMQLRKQKEIGRIGRGVYVCGNARPHKPESVFKRICRAMHVKHIFSAGEIAALTDADTSYVRVVIKKLINKEAIELSSRKNVKKGRMENKFWVKNPDRFYLDYVMKQ